MKQAPLRIPKKFKSTKALLSIKEFAEASGLEQSTLRYWDDIGLFSPAHRNPDTSYRYYSPEQIILVNFMPLCFRSGRKTRIAAMIKKLNPASNNCTGIIVP